MYEYYNNDSEFFEIVTYLTILCPIRKEIINIYTDQIGFTYSENLNNISCSQIDTMVIKVCPCCGQTHNIKLI